MKEAVKRFSAQGFEVVGVSADNTEDILRKWLNEKENGALPWREVFDGRGGPIIKQYRITGYPTNFLIGADGKIIAMNLRGPALLIAVEKALADLKKP